MGRARGELRADERGQPGGVRSVGERCVPGRAVESVDPRHLRKGEHGDSWDALLQDAAVRGGAGVAQTERGQDDGAEGEGPGARRLEGREGVREDAEAITRDEQKREPEDGGEVGDVGRR